MQTSNIKNRVMSPSEISTNSSLWLKGGGVTGLGALLLFDIEDHLESNIDL